MDWSAQIDNYCERVGPGFWAEPVNAVTNAAFLAAAAVALGAARRRGALDAAIVALLLGLGAIGIGSFLFHTVATRWAVLADVIPIQLFIVGFFVLAMRRFAQLSAALTVAATAAFLAASVLGGRVAGGMFGDRLNGSEGYLPPLLALLVVGLALLASGRREAGASLAAGAALFAVSLAFRTLDAGVCPSFPLGTHFVWHTLNGVLLGGLVVALVRYGRPLSAKAPPARSP